MNNLLSEIVYDPSIDKIDQVVVALQNYIIEGQIKSGTAMPSEKKMAEALNVNRFILREALRVVQYQGLLDISRGSKTKVAEFSIKPVVYIMDILLRRSPHFLLDLTEARQGLECSIVELAALRANSEIIDQMLKTITMMEDNFSDLAICIQMDIDFHNLIVKASGNLFYEIILTSISKSLISSREKTIKGYGADTSIKAHKSILNAIMARDSKKARAAMEDHLTITRNQLIELGL